MPKCTGATIDINLVVRQTMFVHGCHGNNSEGFIDFVEINIGRFFADLCKELFKRVDGCRRKPFRRMRMTGVRNDAGAWRQATFFRLTHTHHDNGCCAIGYRTGIGGGYRAVFVKCRT